MLGLRLVPTHHGLRDHVADVYPERNCKRALKLLTVGPVGYAGTGN